MMSGGLFCAVFLPSSLRQLKILWSSNILMHILLVCQSL